jgi:hypothetical protein
LIPAVNAVEPLKILAPFNSGILAPLVPVFCVAAVPNAVPLVVEQIPVTGLQSPPERNILYGAVPPFWYSKSRSVESTHAAPPADAEGDEGAARIAAKRRIDAVSLLPGPSKFVPS